MDLLHRHVRARRRTHCATYFEIADGSFKREGTISAEQAENQLQRRETPAHRKLRAKKNTEILPHVQAHSGSDRWQRYGSAQPR